MDEKSYIPTYPEIEPNTTFSEVRKNVRLSTSKAVRGSPILIFTQL